MGYSDRILEYVERDTELVNSVPPKLSREDRLSKALILLDEAMRRLKLAEIELAAAAK